MRGASFKQRIGVFMGIAHGKHGSKERLDPVEPREIPQHGEIIFRAVGRDAMGNIFDAAEDQHGLRVQRHHILQKSPSS